MNVATAYSKAIDNTHTWGELKQILYAADTRGVSKDSGMTRLRAQDLLLTLVIEKDPLEIPEGSSWSDSMGKVVMNGNGQLINKILREFS